MKITKYYLHAEVDKDIEMIYNTFTTSLFLLEKSTFNSIFNNKAFANYPDEVKKLYDAGFIIDNDFNEEKNIEKIRYSAINSYNEIFHITIALTMKCNARCYYCFENGAERNSMSEETFKNTIDYIYRNSNKKEIFIDWFGGEPLLRFDLLKKMKKELENKGLQIYSSLTTNGLLINDEIIEYLKNENFHFVQITVDAIGEEYNNIRNYITTDKNPFNTVMQNIQKLLDAGVKTHIRINYNENDFEKAKEVFHYLDNAFPGYDATKRFLYMSPIVLEENKEKMYPNCSLCEDHPFYKLLKFQKISDNPVNREYYLQTDPLNRNLTDLMLYPVAVSCGTQSDGHVAIDADGYLYECHRFLGKKQYSSGNVNSLKNGIYEENSIVKYFKNHQLDSDECKICCVMPLCHGGCKAIKYETGIKKRCTPVLQAFPSLLKFYYTEVIKGGNKSDSNSQI